MQYYRFVGGTDTNQNPLRKKESLDTMNTTTNKKEKMTADQAVTFSKFSPASILQIANAVDSRKTEGVHAECECEPYSDFFTFNRWIAQGYGVVKGEKAIKISSFVPVSKNSDDDENQKLRPCTVCLFCRCQVKSAA